MRKVMMTMMALLLAVTVATAQRGQGARGNEFPSELNLTAEQQAQIKAIKQEGRAQMKEMRKQNPDQRPNREALKKMRETSQTKVEAVLTTEQREKLTAIKAERKAAWEAVDKDGMKAALKEHDETKVKPVIAASRAQLDQFISAEDKVALDRLRPVFAAKPKGNMGQSKGKARGKKPTQADVASKKAEMETWKTDHAAEIAELKALTKKYAVEMERIQDRMQPQRKQWAKEKREIMSSYLPKRAKNAKAKKPRTRKGKDRKTDGKARSQREGRKGKKGSKDSLREAAFLLMKG